MIVLALHDIGGNICEEILKANKMTELEGLFFELFKLLRDFLRLKKNHINK